MQHRIWDSQKETRKDLGAPATQPAQPPTSSEAVAPVRLPTPAGRVPEVDTAFQSFDRRSEATPTSVPPKCACATGFVPGCKTAPGASTTSAVPAPSKHVHEAPRTPPRTSLAKPERPDTPFPVTQRHWSMSSLPVHVVRDSRPLLDINKNLLRLDWIKDWTNLVVAGGHILNAVIGDTEASVCGDIDIFLIPSGKGDTTTTTSAATIEPSRVAEILRSISGWLESYYGTVPRVIFSKMGITFLLPQPQQAVPCLKVLPNTTKITVICAKLFASVPELLRSFDLANCEFAYREGELFATEDALQYLQDRQIRVYEKTEASWEGGAAQARKRRLQKYASRPYNTVVQLPGFRPGRSRTVEPLYQEYATENVKEQEQGRRDWCQTTDLETAISLYASRVGRLLSGV